MPDTLTNTELALLGLVAEGPRHGYQIEQDIEARGMRNWSEIGFSSIYYALNKLEAAGWLASERQVDEPGSPVRRVYTITEAGRAVLRAEVRRRLAAPRPRSGDFDLALANLPVLAPDEARAALETQRQALRARLAQVRAKWAADRASGHLPDHASALFDRSLALIQAELDWLERYLSETGTGAGQDEGISPP